MAVLDGWVKGSFTSASLTRDTYRKGAGPVGMCFSGGFALGMMVDDIMIAPVLSQPSLSFFSEKLK